MTRWFLLTLTTSFITAYAVLTEQPPTNQQSGHLSSSIPASLLTQTPNKPDKKTVIGIVRHVEPAKGIVILETRTDVLIVRAPTEVCQQLHKGDVIMATLAPEEEKIPV
jgi:hypothetical protein